MVHDKIDLFRCERRNFAIYTVKIEKYQTRSSRKLKKICPFGQWHFLGIIFTLVNSAVVDFCFKIQSDLIPTRLLYFNTAVYQMEVVNEESIYR